MAHSITQGRHAAPEINKSWESSEFPILCQTCLGDNPYVRMTKEKFGSECKICTRPFTVFRWCPGRGMRFKKTELCQTCARMKNVCQTCILDLEFGLPVEVRDRALGIKDDLPRNEVNREYFLQNMEHQLAATGGLADGSVGAAGAVQTLGVAGAAGGVVAAYQGGSESLLESGSAAPATEGEAGEGGGKILASQLEQLRHRGPYYKRNRPHICSFFVKGTCTRGIYCPYRHEMPTDPNDPLAEQNIKNRYYGVRDPVAAKLSKRLAAQSSRSAPPADKTVTTLFVANVDPALISEDDLRSFFYQFGELRRVLLLPAKKCAFVEYSTREGAELAAVSTPVIKGERLKLAWGRSRERQGEGDESQFRAVPGLPQPVMPRSMAMAMAAAEEEGIEETAGPSTAAPPPVPPPSADAAGPSAARPVFYPSQDPYQFGAHVQDAAGGQPG